MTKPDLQLPLGSRMLHIGPPKTGTTYTQGAMYEVKDQLERHGVLYAGRVRHTARAVYSVTEGRPMVGQPDPNPERWAEIVAEIQASTADRVVLSSEFFADAGPKAIRRIVKDLDPGLHIVVTLRPVAHIMPSQWQQYVQNGTRWRYEEWLHQMLKVPPYRKPTPTFWHRHRHDELIQRWADVVGPERVTVIVVDRSDHSALLRSFEELLALPTGLLQPVDGRDNRSFTQGEIEVLRQFNVEFRQRGWPDSAYWQFIRYGALEELRTREPSHGESRVTTPEWALARAAEIGAEMAARIATLGVRVHGDLSDLSARPSAVGDPPAPDQTVVPAEVAALAVAGAILASGKVENTRLEKLQVSDITSAQLGRVLAKRVVRRVKSTIPGRSAPVAMDEVEGAQGAPPA